MFTKTDTRLNKYISESGLCSRRDADRFIEQGNVYINGKRASVGDRVNPGDQVRVNGQMIEPPEHDEFVLIALNKPVGIVSTTDSDDRNNIVDFVRHSTRIFPIGRLDKDSEGLIFLTSNGDLVNKILRAGNNHEKEYVVTVHKPVTDKFIDGMANGVPILGEVTKKCKVSKEGPNSFRITLVQGLNRQIRRMAEYFGYDVVKLQRVRIMHVDLKGLPVGEWRDFSQKELDVLEKAIENSSSEAQPGKRSRAKGGRSANRSGAGGQAGRSNSPSSRNGGRNSGSSAKSTGRRGDGAPAQRNGSAAKKGGSHTNKAGGRAVAGKAAGGRNAAGRSSGGRGAGPAKAGTASRGAGAGRGAPKGRAAGGRGGKSSRR
ncbi:23S rRNA pseudouridine(2604) synthase RluF [uncultured Umboniibacter sp.]|uniref:23S rRNA pseudouridine(2604) synthase RluF n=1 Tax=uncultured Umboniibacter sp. TaxID=1798917 RepID=UPI00261E16FF|nr:23S rRNA pseudouridine(2604) synthase RluF [uncultured Umboniibacter sp.]